MYNIKRTNVKYNTLHHTGGESIPKNLNISVLLDFYGEMLTEKQREVVELYYNQDLSLAEIALHSGISRQGVRDSIKRAEGQLLEYEERLGLSRRFKDINKGLERIGELVASIRQSNAKMGAHTEIDTCASEIWEIAKTLND